METVINMLETISLTPFSPFQWGGMLGLGLGGLFCFVIIIPLVIQFVIAYWMYKDAKKRGEKEVLWLIVGLVGGIVGLIVWLLVRPDVVRKRF